MSALFTPLKIKDIKMRNRIGVSPMCQYSSIDGVAQPWHMVHLGARAVGGAGLIIAEATGVSPEGRITPDCAGLWNDTQVEALLPINNFIKSHGAVVGVQIGHAGRKGSASSPWKSGDHLQDDSGGWPTLGPTSDVFDPDGKRLWKTPNAMTQADIDKVQDDFVASAKLALDAGYQMLEVHGAHGYLLHSFFSHLVNTRTDQYGGALKGRARMMLEIVEKVRAVWPENLPLAVRLSVVDWVDGGLTIEDNIQMAKWLKERGVDIVDCSGGGATPASRSSVGTRTADQVGLAGELRAGADIATMAVGYITDAQQAEDVIASGTADVALLAREMMRDPYWPLRAAQTLGVNAKSFLPPQLGTFIA